MKFLNSEMVDEPVPNPSRTDSYANFFAQGLELLKRSRIVLYFCDKITIVMYTLEKTEMF